MEQLQNFGPNDAQNGTLAQMFRNAGINDVRSYVDDVRQENFDVTEPTISPVPSNRSMFDKFSNGKNGLNNVKQIYQMVGMKINL